MVTLYPHITVCTALWISMQLAAHYMLFRIFRHRTGLLPITKLAREQYIKLLELKQLVKNQMVQQTGGTFLWKALYACARGK